MLVAFLILVKRITLFLNILNDIKIPYSYLNFLCKTPPFLMIYHGFNLEGKQSI